MLSSASQFALLNKPEIEQIQCWNLVLLVVFKYECSTSSSWNSSQKLGVTKFWLVLVWGFWENFPIIGFQSYCLWLYWCNNHVRLTHRSFFMCTFNFLGCYCKLHLLTTIDSFVQSWYMVIWNNCTRAGTWTCSLFDVPSYMKVMGHLLFAN